MKEIKERIDSLCIEILPNKNRKASSLKGVSTMYNKKLLLTKLADTNEIYIDTIAILSSGFEKLMIKNARSIKDNGQTLTIHRAVINELKQAIENGSPEESNTANEKFLAIKALEEGRIIQYVGNHLEPRSAAQQYLELIMLYRNKKSVSLISNNDKLIHDVLMQNTIQSFSGTPVTAFKITDDGELAEVEAIHTYEVGNTGSKTSAITEDHTARLLKMFGLH